MSAFKATLTEMTDINCIAQAMMEVQPGWKKALENPKNVSQNGQIHLEGYRGDDRASLPKGNHNYAPPCNLRIPRNMVGGAANDIGVSIDEQGKAKLWISDNERGSGYGQAWVDKLTIAYGLIEGKKQAVEAGWTPLTGTSVDLGTPAAALGLTGKCKGIRCGMSRQMAMELAR